MDFRIGFSGERRERLEVLRADEAGVAGRRMLAVLGKPSR